MAPSSQRAGGDGRAHRRTTPGQGYQVRLRTMPDRRAAGTVVPPRLPLPAMRRRSTRAMLLSAAVALALAACAGEPAASFDPTGPCIADGSTPGAYPELEARIPTTYEDRGPETLDSGRNCTAENLGSLAAAGFDEIRFAGGTWDFGGNRAAALVVFTAPGLTADAIADFYAESAQAANRTQVTGESEPQLAGRPGRRLDSTTGNRTQTVVVWPAADADHVNVVITNDLPDPKILSAVDAFGGD